MKLWTILAAMPAFALAAPGPAAPPAGTAGSDYAARVTITRDDWGIAQSRGERDADAVFGAIYAQAEDDFPRIEANLLHRARPDCGGRGRERPLAGPGATPLDRCGCAAGRLSAQPSLAPGADGCLGGGAEPLSRDPSRRASAGAHAFRAVDGSQLYRGQHWRRHRARRPRPSSRSFYDHRMRGDPLVAADSGLMRSAARPTASPSRPASSNT